MTYWQQSGSSDLVASQRADGRVGPLSRGLGLAIGAVISLGLWMGLSYLAVRLLG